MDPQPSTFDSIMYPTALFAPPMITTQPALAEVQWNCSFQNPKNRIDSLNPVSKPRWRIDGVEADGLRFFAVPAFAVDEAPLRIDVCIPDITGLNESWVRILDPCAAMLCTGSKVSSLPLTNYILRALEHWLDEHPDAENSYWSMPFGSYIVINNPCADVKRASVHLIPVYETEQQWMSVKALQNLWQLSQDTWPKIIGLEELQLHYQLHDTISFVRIKNRHASQLFIFKSLLQDVKYMYHELHVLLTIEQHPNIIARPMYIVTKHCRFGGKVGVCGFVIEYHPEGTLKDLLFDCGTDIDLNTRLRWAHEIISAVMHIRRSPAGFYSDVKLNNIVMARCDYGLKPVLVDFEQRGGWYSWSPPEVYLVEYIEHIASSNIPEGARVRYRDLLQSHLPHWEPTTLNKPYMPSKHGFSAAWVALSEEAKESAMVFMFGKLLWCLFEGVGSVNSGITPETFREEHSDLAFPVFRRTPPPLRQLIKECTRGAPEWSGRYPALERRGNKLHPRGCGDGEATPEDVQSIAREWWKSELKGAEEYLGLSRLGNSGGSPAVQNDVGQVASTRPRLSEVQSAVDEARSVTEPLPFSPRCGFDK